MKTYITTLFGIVLFGTINAQSIEYSQTAGLSIKKDNIGLTHTDGTISLGTYMSSALPRAYLQTHSNHPLYFGINNSSTPSIVLNTNGNFGVNMPDDILPAEKLEIRNGRLGLYGWETPSKPTGIVFTNNAGNTEVGRLGMRDATTFGVFSNTTNQFEFISKTLGTSKFGLGIDPTYELDVNGNIRIENLSSVNGRGIVMIADTDDFWNFEVQPTINISPFDFTFSDEGSLSGGNANFTPSPNYSLWSTSPSAVYHYVEKPLDLIQGSTIRSFSANLFDNTAGGRIRACLYVQNSLTGAISNSYCLSTTAQASSIQQLSQNTINHVVNNQTNTYFIRVESLDNLQNQGPWFNTLGFGTMKLDVGY